MVGFSQGGAMAAIIASLLEDGRESAFNSTTSPCSPFPFPKTWTLLKTTLPQPPLRFAVSYSGFYAPLPPYAPFYTPKIATRFLHVIGSLDSVVEEERSVGLVDRCEKATKVVHPGGHFVPVGKEFAGVLVGFLRDVLKEEEKKGEERVEDMDMPL